MDDVDSGPVDAYLDALADQTGSDLLLVAGSPPVLRVAGAIQRLGDQELSAAQVTGIVEKMLPANLLERLRERRDADFSFGWGPDARVRGHAFHQRGSYALSLRLIPRDVPTAEALGLPDVIAGLADATQGLVLVTGPTGSGKSSTLAAMIRRAGERRASHIVTIEDPIEYFHRHGTSVVTQREIGTDAISFPHALRAVLREDPDIVLVGEMRDAESIEATLTVAETGHLVLATLHANDAPQAVDRVIDSFPPERQAQVRTQLAATLLGVVAQRLVPAVAGGRVVATEALLVTTAVRNLIRDGKTEQLRNVMMTAQKGGMHTLESQLDALVKAGVITQVAADAAKVS
jgi:twitching motility protein PilT